MKNYIFATALSVAALGFAACTDEQDAISAKDGNIVFTSTYQAAEEGLSKTSIVNGVPMFDSGDALLVYGNNNSSATLNNVSSSRSTTTTFSGSLDNDAYANFSAATTYYGVLPSSAFKSVSDLSSESATITMSLPSSQAATLNGVDPDAYLLVGATSSNAFSFKNVTAFLKVYVSESITSLTITSDGAPIAGDASIAISSNNNTFSISAISNPQTTITLGAMESGYYYVPVLPGTYKLSVTYKYADDSEEVLSLSQKNTHSNQVLSVKAGVTLPMNVLHEYVPSSATAISFLYSVPDGYTEITKESKSGTYDIPEYIHIYQSNSTTTEYVVTSDKGYYILAPENCTSMFIGDYGSGNGFYPSVTAITFTNFNTKNVTNMSGMFAYSSVTSLDLSGFNTAKVTDMSRMFYNFNGTSLDVSSFNTTAVTSMSNMFAKANVPTLDLSNFVTSSLTDMSGMFYYNYAVTTLDIRNFNTAKVTDMSGMFVYCTNLTTIYSYDFSTASSPKSTSMFYMTLDLKGTDGSYEYKFVSKNSDATYAKVCKAADAAAGTAAVNGYFTDPKYKSASSK